MYNINLNRSSNRSTSRQPQREYTTTGEELKLIFDFVRCEECMLTEDKSNSMTYRSEYIFCVKLNSTLLMNFARIFVIFLVCFNLFF